MSYTDDRELRDMCFVVNEKDLFSVLNPAIWRETFEDMKGGCYGEKG